MHTCPRLEQAPRLFCVLPTMSGGGARISLTGLSDHQMTCLGAQAGAYNSSILSGEAEMYMLFLEPNMRADSAVAR